MKKYTAFSSNQEGYSIIAAILMIGFLLVLTTSTLNLVLQDMQDGKGRQNYIKAYGGAEGAMELALLKIKKEGYGFYEEIDESEILGTRNRAGVLSYDIESESNSYTGSLDVNGIDIIPLFAIDASGDISNITTIDYIESSGDIIWNMVGPSAGVSGTGDFNHSTPAGIKELNAVDNLEYNNAVVGDILVGNGSYLILQNFSSSAVQYTLSANEEFSKPRAVIESSSKVGKYSQNLATTVDNTEFLGILKYSIYSE